MIKRWFIPSRSGDYRLEAEGETSVLTVVDPTLQEVEHIQAFLGKARRRGWITGGGHVKIDGESRVCVSATVAEAAKVLLVVTGNQQAGTFTAVKSAGGVVTAVAPLAEVPRATEEAVTVRRPTPCCPEPHPAAEQRASEALRAFCFPEQWKDWTELGYLHCIGKYTGHRYRIAHRHGATAQAQGRICADLSDRAVLHFHDNLLPPPEEVLAAKLVLEHREDWLRNPSTCLSERFRQVFRNPLGPQGVDGVADARLVQGIGFLGMWARAQGYIEAEP